MVRLFIRFCSIMKVLTENKTTIITDEVRQNTDLLDIL